MINIAEIDMNKLSVAELAEIQKQLNWQTKAAERAEGIQRKIIAEKDRLNADKQADEKLLAAANKFVCDIRVLDSKYQLKLNAYEKTYSVPSYDMNYVEIGTHYTENVTLHRPEIIHPCGITFKVCIGEKARKRFYALKENWQERYITNVKTAHKKIQLKLLKQSELAKRTAANKTGIEQITEQIKNKYPEAELTIETNWEKDYSRRGGRNDMSKEYKTLHAKFPNGLRVTFGYSADSVNPANYNAYIREINSGYMNITNEDKLAFFLSIPAKAK